MVFELTIDAADVRRVLLGERPNLLDLLINVCAGGTLGDRDPKVGDGCVRLRIRRTVSVCQWASAHPLIQSHMDW